MRSAVIIFPGSNCDLDMYKAIRDVLKEPVDYVWHTESSLSGYDAVFLPGGFSYGDYLRCGAIARFSPIMKAVREAAKAGMPILGVCNGFQILVEAGILPGALTSNTTLRFRCHPVTLRVENDQTPFTLDYRRGEEIVIPIAHGDGCFYCDTETLTELRKKGQIVFRYSRENPNGSVDDIAGITNPAGNVLGMMPHPERAVRQLLGSIDGQRLFTSILRYWRGMSRAS